MHACVWVFSHRSMVPSKHCCWLQDKRPQVVKAKILKRSQDKRASARMAAAEAEVWILLDVISMQSCLLWSESAWDR